jgi:PA14 domain
MTKIKLVALSAATALSVVALAATAGAQTYPSASVTYYSTFNDTGSSITMSDPFQTDVISSIHENRDIGGGDTDPNWPNGGTLFAADFTSTFDAPTSRTYTFTMGTDDGGYLFVDGNLAINQGGSHGITFDSDSLFLSAGPHSIELQYDNTACCGAVVDLAVPEPGGWSLLLVGLFGVGALLRRRPEETATA